MFPSISAHYLEILKTTIAMVCSRNLAKIGIGYGVTIRVFLGLFQGESRSAQGVFIPCFVGFFLRANMMFGSTLRRNGIQPPVSLAPLTGAALTGLLQIGLPDGGKEEIFQIEKRWVQVPDR